MLRINILFNLNPWKSSVVCSFLVIPFQSKTNENSVVRPRWNLFGNTREENVLPYQTIVLKQGHIEHSHLSIEANENNLVRDQGISIEGFPLPFFSFSFFQNPTNFDIALNYVKSFKTMN